MSQRTLTFERLQDGVLTDVTSVVLADSTAAYGVRDSVSLAVVIAAGTAMTHASTGVYTYTNVLLDSGTAYDWVAKVTELDGSISFVPFTAPAVATHYGSRAGIEAWYGSINVATYFDVDDNQNAAVIAANIEYGLSTFDNLVRRRFREGVKLNGVNIAVAVPVLGDNYYESLAPIADEWTGAWGYFKRGKFDNNGKPDGAMQYHLDHAEAELAMLIQSVYSHALTPANTFQFVEIEGDEDATDEYSRCW